MDLLKLFGFADSIQHISWPETIKNLGVIAALWWGLSNWNKARKIRRADAIPLLVDVTHNALVFDACVVNRGNVPFVVTRVAYNWYPVEFRKKWRKIYDRLTRYIPEERSEICIDDYVLVKAGDMARVRIRVDFYPAPVSVRLYTNEGHDITCDAPYREAAELLMMRILLEGIPKFGGGMWFLNDKTRTVTINAANSINILTLRGLLTNRSAGKIRKAALESMAPMLEYLSPLFETYDLPDSEYEVGLRIRGKDDHKATLFLDVLDQVQHLKLPLPTFEGSAPLLVHLPQGHTAKPMEQNAP